MLRIIVVVLCLALASVVRGNASELIQPQCVLEYGWNSTEFPCNGYLSTDPRCNNSFINIADTSFYKCSDVRMLWNYPMQNVTITIDSENYSKSKQPYTVSFKPGFNLPTYRIYPNGQEFLISNRSVEQVAEPSDENFQVVLKFQGPTRLKYYGANIQYQIAPARY